MIINKSYPVVTILFCLSIVELFCQTNSRDSNILINELGYYEIQGLNVMMFDNFYPEGHQGGLTITQNGVRVAANGDVRLEPTPGQWSPVPKVIDRTIDKDRGIISVKLSYPDDSKDRKGFNPINYPDLKLDYTIRTEAFGNNIKLIVDLENPLPNEWADKVGFNIELFPGHLFGEFYLMDEKSGAFPRQINGPMFIDTDSNLQSVPLAIGNELLIAPGNPEKEIKITSNKNKLLLIDERGLHNNGWFVVRSTISEGVTKNAVEWIITPTINTNWRYKPVIQLSQVGYHPRQNKFAVIELDKLSDIFDPIQLIKVENDTTIVIKEDLKPDLWGYFLRYKYLRFDFTDVKDDGIYKIKYGKLESNQFEIKNDIYNRNVWQPTLETFLPVQMCHMRIEDRYKVWHGLCHMDDALMSPINHNHFDGYIQYKSTLIDYNSGEHIPGLNIGGWHDAGDYDLRIESQAETVYKLALAYEFFKDDYDETTINQETRIVELHKPDGKADILQQIEHGVLSIVGGYESMGRLYRGIICPTLKQYVHLGDAATMSDNLVVIKNENDPILNKQLPKDDRWVFTEENPERELCIAQTFAAAYRVLKNFNSELAVKCLKIAEKLYNSNPADNGINKINAAAVLYLSTSKKMYEEIILNNTDLISENILDFSEVIGRVEQKLNQVKFSAKIEKAVLESFRKIAADQKENPYGVPYKPYIWGAGWGIQSFGVKQLFLHLGFPKIFSSEYVFNALNFILGCHPGENNASFVSGVGVNSLTVAYGVNRDEWSYIPGGIGSGTALIRPDFPELKVWPYFWQQTEYVIGGGTVDFLLLAMAADHLFNKKETH
jgi:endoglucanase